jgi:hypothetical protein
VLIAEEDNCIVRRVAQSTGLDRYAYGQFIKKFTIQIGSFFLQRFLVVAYIVVACNLKARASTAELSARLTSSLSEPRSTISSKITLI